MAASDVWHLVAPGPSLTKSLCESLRGENVGAVSNAFELAPFANFIAASDRDWWIKNRAALDVECEKYSIIGYDCRVVQTHVPGMRGTCNSGVLALEISKRKGARKIYLHGFDMHGSHFFGDYTNGLINTTDARRKIHLQEYRAWAEMNNNIEVINCTVGSAIDCFPFEIEGIYDCAGHARAW